MFESEANNEKFKFDEKLVKQLRSFKEEINKLKQRPMKQSQNRWNNESVTTFTHVTTLPQRYNRHLSYRNGMPDHSIHTFGQKNNEVARNKLNNNIIIIENRNKFNNSHENLPEKRKNYGAITKINCSDVFKNYDKYSDNSFISKINENFNQRQLTEAGKKLLSYNILYHNEYKLGVDKTSKNITYGKMNKNQKREIQTEKLKENGNYENEDISCDFSIINMKTHKKKFKKDCSNRSKSHTENTLTTQNSAEKAAKPIDIDLDDSVNERQVIPRHEKFIKNPSMHPLKINSGIIYGDKKHENGVKINNPGIEINLINSQLNDSTTPTKQHPLNDQSVPYNYLNDNNNNKINRNINNININHNNPNNHHNKNNHINQNLKNSNDNNNPNGNKHSLNHNINPNNNHNNNPLNSMGTISIATSTDWCMANSGFYSMSGVDGNQVEVYVSYKMDGSVWLRFGSNKAQDWNVEKEVCFPWICGSLICGNLNFRINCFNELRVLNEVLLSNLIGLEL